MAVWKLYLLYGDNVKFMTDCLTLPFLLILTGSQADQILTTSWQPWNIGITKCCN